MKYVHALDTVQTIITKWTDHGFCFRGLIGHGVRDRKANVFLYLRLTYLSTGFQKLVHGPAGKSDYFGSSFLPDSLVWFIGLFSPHSLHSQGKNLNSGPVKSSVGDSLMVQFLELHVPTAGGVGLIPGRATKILCAM